MEQLYEFDVLRVDRTTAAHGLEIREPFLDKASMQHYFNLPANIKCPRNGIEKYHLRKAIEVTYPGLLPQEILWRQKKHSVMVSAASRRSLGSMNSKIMLNPSSLMSNSKKSEDFITQCQCSRTLSF